MERCRESGTVRVDVNDEDESTLFLGATGTPDNDLFHRIKILEKDGRKEEAVALMDSVLAEKQAGPLALRLAPYHCQSSYQYLRVLDKLTPELDAMPYVAQTREELTRRIKTEPRPEGVDFIPVYIDMDYPDVHGNPVSTFQKMKRNGNSSLRKTRWTGSTCSKGRGRG